MIFRFILQLVIIFSFSFSYASFNKVKELEADNGLKIWYIEDHYLPIVSLKIAFNKAGKSFDPKDKLGIANMVSYLLEEGTETMSAVEYNSKLEELATSLYFEVDEEYFYVIVKTLSYNLEKVLGIINEVLTKPEFSEEAIEEVKDKIRVIIKNKSTNLQYIASREIIKSLVGAEHPYAKDLEGTEKTISSITREDLINFVKTRFTLDNTTISMVGDLKEKDIIKSTNSIFKDVPLVSSSPVSDLLPFKKRKQGKTVNIKFDSVQTIIVFGGYAPNILDNDFHSTYIANHILGGGGFESRFVNELREKKGLAYGIYSYLDSSVNRGFWVGSMYTKNNAASKALALIKQEISKVKKYGFEYDEFKNSKNYLINSFPLRLTKNSNLANILNFMQIQNMGIDFLEKRNDYFLRTVVGEVNRAAYEWFDLKNITFVIVGSPKSK